MRPDVEQCIYDVEVAGVGMPGVRAEERLRAQPQADLLLGVKADEGRFEAQPSWAEPPPRHQVSGENAAGILKNQFAWNKGEGKGPKLQKGG
jgi:hypothetical protein